MTKHPANEYLNPQEDAELAFNKWFYGDFYGSFTFRYEYFMDDIKIGDENQRKEMLMRWVESAFISGYECALRKQNKLQQFWIRRLMWKWCFECWLNLQFPHIYLKTHNSNYDYSIDELDNKHWFWMYLNNFNGNFEND